MTDLHSNTAERFNVSLIAEKIFFELLDYCSYPDKRIEVIKRFIEDLTLLVEFKAKVFLKVMEYFVTREEEIRFVCPNYSSILCALSVKNNKEKITSIANKFVKKIVTSNSSEDEFQRYVEFLENSAFSSDIKAQVLLFVLEQVSMEELSATDLQDQKIIYQ